MRNMHRIRLLVLTLLVTLLLQACGQETVTVEPTEMAGRDGAIQNVADAMGALEAQGVSAEATDKVEQPFFPVEGQNVQVNGQNVQFFEFAEPSAAEAAALTVNATGDAIGTSMVAWVEPPHFYRSGALIALYVGSDESVLNALNTVFGPQFAGR